MSGPVPEIERPCGAVFEGITVGSNVIQMKLRAPCDEALHGGKVAGGVAWRGFAEFFKKGAVADDGDFEGFGDAAEPVAVGEGKQKIEVVNHGEWWGEGSNRVFSEEVDGIFHSDPGVVLGEHGRGDADEAESAVDECGGEANGVEDGAAADDDDEALSVHALFEQLGEELFDEAEVIF